MSVSASNRVIPFELGNVMPSIVLDENLPTYDITYNSFRNRVDKLKIKIIRELKMSVKLEIKHSYYDPIRKTQGVLQDDIYNYKKIFIPLFLGSDAEIPVINLLVNRYMIFMDNKIYFGKTDYANAKLKIINELTENQNELTENQIDAS